MITSGGDLLTNNCNTITHCTSNTYNNIINRTLLNSDITLIALELDNQHYTAGAVVKARV